MSVYTKLKFSETLTKQEQNKRDNKKKKKTHNENEIKLNHQHIIRKVKEYDKLSIYRSLFALLSVFFVAVLFSCGKLSV